MLRRGNASKGALAQAYPSPLLGFGKMVLYDEAAPGACSQKSSTLDSDGKEKNADT